MIDGIVKQGKKWVWLRNQEHSYFEEYYGEKKKNGERIVHI